MVMVNGCWNEFVAYPLTLQIQMTYYKSIKFKVSGICVFRFSKVFWHVFIHVANLSFSSWYPWPYPDFEPSWSVQPKLVRVAAWPWLASSFTTGELWNSFSSRPPLNSREGEVLKCYMRCFVRHSTAWHLFMHSKVVALPNSLIGNVDSKYYQVSIYIVYM